MNAADYTAVPLTSLPKEKISVRQAGKKRSLVCRDIRATVCVSFNPFPSPVFSPTFFCGLNGLTSASPVHVARHSSVSKTPTNIRRQNTSTCGISQRSTWQIWDMPTPSCPQLRLIAIRLRRVVILYGSSNSERTRKPIRRSDRAPRY
jgi:hypothetical protein